MQQILKGHCSLLWETWKRFQRELVLMMLMASTRWEGVGEGEMGRFLEMEEVVVGGEVGVRELLEGSGCLLVMDWTRLEQTQAQGIA